MQPSESNLNKNAGIPTPANLSTSAEQQEKSKQIPRLRSSRSRGHHPTTNEHQSDRQSASAGSSTKSGSASDTGNRDIQGQAHQYATVTSTPSMQRASPSARTRKSHDTSLTLALQNTSKQALTQRTLTQEQRAEERSRKGRERSMRTRKRNAHRLKLLQDNCAHLRQENSLLRDLIMSVRRKADGQIIANLLRTLAGCRKSRPPPHEILTVGTESRQGALPSGYRNTTTTTTQVNPIPVVTVRGTQVLPAQAPTSIKQISDRLICKSENHLNTGKEPPPITRSGDTISTNASPKGDPDSPQSGDADVTATLQELGEMAELTVEEVVRLMKATEK